LQVNVAEIGHSPSRSTDATTPAPLRIVSGGQTGVDRGALDAALAAGVPAGGWCPRGRLAEDGPLPRRYPLDETVSRDPSERTRLNVRDSNATLILAPAEPREGTAIALAAARKLRRPFLVLDPRRPDAPELAARWAITHDVATLNVAGPRSSEWDEGYEAAFGLVAELIRRLDESRGGGRT
jgi:hypothetical protein